MSLHEHFGANLKKRRIELGFTQAELASLVGVRRELIAAYEAGLNDNPTLKTIEKFADKMSCPALSLLLENENSIVSVK